MQTLQFLPEFVSINKLLRHNIIQTLIVLGNVVDIAIFSDGFEVATGTLNLAFLGAESPRGHCRFKSKYRMLHLLVTSVLSSSR